MNRIVIFLGAIMIALCVKAQMKVAILETVDKAQNVNYGVKLLLRSSLTAAISNTNGYEGYDRVDMASIASEQEFQRTGNVSDDQIKQIGQAAGASYILVAEAAKYDATSIIITAKLIDVVTFGVKSSAVLVSGVSADEMQETCNALSAKLLNQPYTAKTRSKPSQSSQQFQEQPSAPKQSVGEVGSVIVFPDNTRGIIFYKNNGKGLAVSVEGVRLSWLSSKKGQDIAQIPNSENDNFFEVGLGEQYTRAILSQASGNAPAAEWCAKLGTGWYLPSAGELSCFLRMMRGMDIRVLSVLNRELLLSGGTMIAGGWYWSSSEYNSKEAINISYSGSIATEDKVDKLQVRAVRAFSY